MIWHDYCITIVDDVLRCEKQVTLLSISKLFMPGCVVDLRVNPLGWDCVKVLVPKCGNGSSLFPVQLLAEGGAA